MYLICSKIETSPQNPVFLIKHIACTTQHIVTLSPGLSQVMERTKDNIVRLSTKSSSFLIHKPKKVRVASPKSKVQQRVDSKNKPNFLLWYFKMFLNFWQSTIGGQSLSARHRWRFGPGVNFWNYFWSNFWSKILIDFVKVRLATAKPIKIFHQNVSKPSYTTSYTTTKKFLRRRIRRFWYVFMKNFDGFRRG